MSQRVANVPNMGNGIAWDVQGQQVLKDGIGRGTEVEEDIDPKEARKYLMDPGSLYSLESDVLQPILRYTKSLGRT